MHTQNLNKLETLHQAVENAIAKQPEANAEQELAVEGATATRD
jgi:hypothetical protein